MPEGTDPLFVNWRTGEPLPAAVVINPFFVTPQMFGARGDGVTDDTVAIQAAFDSGEALYIPPGVYIVSAPLTVSLRDQFTMIGWGRQASRFRFIANGGILINMNGPVVSTDRGCVLSSFGLDTTIVNTAIALHVNYNAVSELMTRSVFFYDISAEGTVQGSTQFAQGYRFTNCRSGVCRNPYWRGDAVTPFSRGIALDGDCIEFHIESPQLYDGDVGIEVTGHPEGITIFDHDIVGFNTGVYYDPTVPQDMLIVSNGHISCGTVAIQIIDSVNFLITGNVITDRAIANFVAIDMINSTHGCVTDNYILSNFSSGGSTTFGILAHGDTRDNLIKSNRIRNFDVGVQLDSGVVNTFVSSDNRYFGVGTSVINNSSSSTNIVYMGEDSEGTITLPTGATPSVAGWEDTVWVTNNGGATTITNFLNGREGQDIIILAGDNNTTIQHSVDIQLSGSVNFVMTAGQILVLRKIASFWRELSRKT